MLLLSTPTLLFKDNPYQLLEHIIPEFYYCILKSIHIYTNMEICKYALKYYVKHLFLN